MQLRGVRRVRVASPVFDVDGLKNAVESVEVGFARDAENFESEGCRKSGAGGFDDDAVGGEVGTEVGKSVGELAYKVTADAGGAGRISEFSREVEAAGWKRPTSRSTVR